MDMNFKITRTVTIKLEPISALNTNYDPPREWVCMTPEEHACEYHVIGKIGAYPVCGNGAAAEAVARVQDAIRIDKLMNTDEMQRAIEAELAYERRANRY